MKILIMMVGSLGFAMASAYSRQTLLRRSHLVKCRLRLTNVRETQFS